MARVTRRTLLGSSAATALAVGGVSAAPVVARGAECASAGRDFFVGEAPYQSYVHYYPAIGQCQGRPLVMVHGGNHTGVCFEVTPDKREGWAPYFARKGWDVYVVDWPGHGRSGFPPDFTTMSTTRVVDAVVALAKSIGPVVLFGHSIGGQVAWLVADRARSALAGIVGVAPAAPANIVPPLPSSEGVPETAPSYSTRDFAQAFFANADRFPHAAFEAYFRELVPESPRVINELINAGGVGIPISGPQILAGLPILITTGDQDPRHPREVDQALATWAGADFVWLPNVGLPGHGHMQMLDAGNLQIADLIMRWLGRRVK